MLVWPSVNDLGCFLVSAAVSRVSAHTDRAASCGRRFQVFTHVSRCGVAGSCAYSVAGGFHIPYVCESVGRLTSSCCRAVRCLTSLWESGCAFSLEKYTGAGHAGRLPQLGTQAALPPMERVSPGLWTQ